MKIEVSTKECARFFDISRQGLAEWHLQGCPKDSRGKWNLKQVYDWLIDHKSQNQSIEDARLRWHTARAEKMETEVKKEREELISHDEVVSEWVARVVELKRGLQSWSSRLPMMLEGRNKAEMKKLIRAEVWDLLDQYSRKGKYTPTPKNHKGKVA